MANEDSEYTYEQIQSLNHSENNVLLLLIWSTECTGRTSKVFHAWAISEHGQVIYRRLVEYIGYPATAVQVVLNLVALLSFLRLQPYVSSKTKEAEANRLSDFHSLLKGPPSCKARETLEHAGWSLWTVTSHSLDAIESRTILKLLAHVFDTASIPECSDEDMGRYWGSRFNPARSHDDALSNILDVSERFALPVQSKWLKLNGKGLTNES